MKRNGSYMKTAIAVWTILLVHVVKLGVADVEECQIWTVNDPHRCQRILVKQGYGLIHNVGILPGMGWDNLRNVEAGQVVDYSYKQCTLTTDGQRLIPDNFVSSPVKVFGLKASTQIVEHWLSAKSSTASSINGNIDVSVPHVSVSGAFSAEKSELQEKQTKLNVVTVRTELRLARYQVWLQPDTTLSPNFRERLLGIAGCIENQSMELANYETEMLVRDYGTHVVTSVTGGASIVLEDDFTKESFSSLQASNDSKSIALKAEVSYAKIAKASISGKYEEKESNSVSEGYEKSRAQTRMTSLGGGLTDVTQIDFKEWYKGVEVHLVPIDRAGEPLHYVITKGALPEIKPQSLVQVVALVRRAISNYYKTNAVEGCARPDSKGYNPQANVMRESACSDQDTALAFGGFYHTCSSETDASYCYFKSQGYNPTTGARTCPVNHKAILLYDKVIDEEFIYLNATDNPNTKTVTLKYNLYWCAGSGKSSTQHSSLLFGGLYTKNAVNILTHEQSCPASFKPYNIFPQMTMCLSPQNRDLEAMAAPFGGFFSCDHGNAFAGGSRTCPAGFLRIVALQYRSCLIFYCVKTKINFSMKTPRRPPYMSPPVDKRNSEYSLIEEVSDDGSIMLTRGQAAGLCIGAAILTTVVCAAFLYLNGKSFRGRKFWHLAALDRAKPPKKTDQRDLLNTHESPENIGTSLV